MRRARDNQRQRLYDAERNLQHGTQVMRTRGAPECMSIAECQSYVDKLTREAWFIRRWGRRQISVFPTRNGGHAGGSTMYLGVWARQEIIVLHELAHCLMPRECKRYHSHGYTSYEPASHGPEYAGVLLTLVRHRMGREVGEKLRSAYRAGRVRVNMRAVPKPDDRKLEYVRAKDRERKQAASRPPTRDAANDAAALIRRAVKAGVFGPGGCKPRAHALETARRLTRVAQVV